MGSSPLTRGAHSLDELPEVAGGIIPAYAGSTELLLSNAWDARDHPRLRGEHRESALPENHVLGSSPLTRGARVHCEAHGLGCGIIPAYAGSTNAKLMPCTSRRDHPRLRGEHARKSTSFTVPSGSSPLTRGALLAMGNNGGIVGIIPAYAGSTISKVLEVSAVKDHPRLRGEHMVNELHLSGNAGSSPLTRGARF